MRAALGASRWQLAAQMLTESTLARAARRRRRRHARDLESRWQSIALSPQNVPRFQETRIDLVALAFTAVVAIMAAGILVGLWPAWHLDARRRCRRVARSRNRGGSGGAGRQKARSALVVTQVALAVVLLAGAGLTLKSFWRAQQEPLNFDPTTTLSVGIALPEARYNENEQK